MMRRTKTTIQQMPVRKNWDKIVAIIKTRILKPIGFSSKFQLDTEKNYAINELELLALEWGLEPFKLNIYG